MRRCVILLVLVLFASLCLTLPASAGSGTDAIRITVDRGINPNLEEAPLLRTDRGRWTDADGQPRSRVPSDYEGSPLYELPVHKMADGELAEVQFTAAQDLSAHQQLRLLCRVLSKELAQRDQRLTVTLWAGEEQVTGTVELPTNQWCAVQVDIGSWDAREAITRIALRYAGSAEFQFAYLRTDEAMDAELQERFLTDAFTAQGGKVFLSPGADRGYLVAIDNSPMLTANVLVPSSPTVTNALRFVFENETSCRSVTLQYAYAADGANPRSVTREVGEGRQICLFEVPDAARVRYIRLIFTGAKEGLITLRALNAVSIYESGIEPLGAINTCAVAADGRTIRISGTVAHDVMITNRENSLALFVLEPWETMEDALTDGREPDATAAISIRFNFSLPYRDSDYAALSAAYAVAIRTGNAESGYTYTPLTEPHSLTVQAEPVESATNGASKGVQTELVSTANQTGVSIYVVDVCLDRLYSRSAAGYRYVGGADSLFFDHAVLDALDEAVRLRSAAGECVYLRYLISNDGADVHFALASDETADDAVRGILVNSAEARETIGAITAFLCRRYNGGADGKISGIIVGSQVDDAAASNAIGLYALADYVDHYADLLTLIANTARQIDPAMQVIVPISDRRPAECITQALLENSYDSELFLRSLFKRLDDMCGPTVSLMLESKHNPFSLADGVFDINHEDDAMPTDETEPTYYNADELSDFSSLVDAMSAVYAGMPSTFIYAWTPEAQTGDALAAAYAYLYYRLRFSTHAEAFIVSFAEAEAAGDFDGMMTLKHLMKYIDTARSLEVSEPCLAVLGIDNWQTLIAAFDEERLISRVWHEGALSSPVESTLGSHVYWDFSGAYSTRGWYAGTHVGNLSVRGSGSDRGLEARFDRTKAETGAYSEIIYPFSPGEPLAVLDRLAFDLCVEGDGVWEVCVTVGTIRGTAGRLEQKQVVEAGKRTTLCLTTGMLGRALSDYLKISVKPVSGSGEGMLCLYRVTGESDSLTDSALAVRLSETRRMESDQSGREEAESGIAWVFVTCAVVIFTVSIAVILGRYQEEEIALEREKLKEKAKRTRR